MAHRPINREYLERAAEKTEVEIQWLSAYYGFCNSKAWEPEREIVVSVFEGHYGTAGAVIAINGSPMRGTMLVKSDSIRETQPTIPHPFTHFQIENMYVLHGSETPKKLRNIAFWGYGNRKTKHEILWKATVALLVERGLLPKIN